MKIGKAVDVELVKHMRDNISNVVYNHVYDNVYPTIFRYTYQKVRRVFDDIMFEFEIEDYENR